MHLLNSWWCTLHSLRSWERKGMRDKKNVVLVVMTWRTWGQEGWKWFSSWEGFQGVRFEDQAAGEASSGICSILPSHQFLKLACMLDSPGELLTIPECALWPGSIKSQLGGSGIQVSVFFKYHYFFFKRCPRLLWCAAVLGPLTHALLLCIEHWFSHITLSQYLDKWLPPRFPGSNP